MRCHLDAVYFWRDLQIFLFHVDRLVFGGVFQTVRGIIFVCKVGSLITVSNLRDMLVVDTMFAVWVESSRTALGTVRIEAPGFVRAV